MGFKDGDVMSKRAPNLIKYSSERSHRTRERIISALSDPSNIRLTQHQIAQKIRLSSRTLRAHLKSDPSIRHEARELYRAHYVPAEMLAVDRAMLQTAKTPGKDGTPDRKLAYRVMDGVGDREDIGAGQELEVVIRCVDDYTGLAAQVGVRIRPERGGAL